MIAVLCKFFPFVRFPRITPPPMHRLALVSCASWWAGSVDLVAPGSARACGWAEYRCTSGRGRGQIQEVYVRPPQDALTGSRSRWCRAARDGRQRARLRAMRWPSRPIATAGCSSRRRSSTATGLIPTDRSRRPSAGCLAFGVKSTSCVDRSDYPVEPQVLVFGHSRGAQLALRFTEIHPELVAGVAAISAGTYTLPSDTTTAHNSCWSFRSASPIWPATTAARHSTRPRSARSRSGSASAPTTTIRTTCPMPGTRTSATTAANGPNASPGPSRTWAATSRCTSFKAPATA